MNFWITAGEFTFAVLILFFLLFSVSSFREGEKRAFRRSAFVFISILALNFAFLFLFKEPLKEWFLGGIFVLFGSVVLLLMLFPFPGEPVKIVGDQKRIDERDVIFARFDYRQETRVYENYYKRRPYYREIDDEIRKLPDVLTSFHSKKHPLLLPLAEAEFEFLRHNIFHVDGKERNEKTNRSASENTWMIKEVLRYLGADIVGVSPLNQAYVYSHVGRGPEPYGRKIEPKHKNAVAFAVEMDFEMIVSAPRPQVIVETGKKYVEAAVISIIAADYIRRLGYSARAHVAGSNYQGILPPIAWEAGLGEVGRIGILVSWKYGPRIRLGLITTDLPLVADEPVNLGIQDFCRRCKKCATNCPSQAIPHGDETEENGVLKWVINREKCYRFWRRAGTDCAVCIYVCPYSKPSNFFHNIIRKLTTFSNISQALSIWGDDFFYGRSPRRKSPHKLSLY